MIFEHWKTEIAALMATVECPSMRLQHEIKITQKTEQELTFGSHWSQ